MNSSSRRSIEGAHPYALERNLRITLRNVSLRIRSAMNPSLPDGCRHFPRRELDHLPVFTFTWLGPQPSLPKAQAWYARTPMGFRPHLGP
jgi:hypothetical protein